jgi:S1-C subfamily serine protease
MADPYGAIFGQPEPGSPAAHEGIEADDVVTAAQGGVVSQAQARD